MRKAAIISFALCVLGSWCTMAGQTAKPVWKGTITTENEITVVRNPKEPLYRGEVLQLKEEISIGKGEKEGEYLFADIGSPFSAMVVDDQGSIYMLDFKDCQVKVFDANGRFLNVFSRNGQGPGDLANPFQILLSPRKEIIIESLRTRTLDYFSADGHFLKRDNWSASAATTFILDDQGEYIGLSVTPNTGKGPEYQLKAFRPDMRFLRLLERRPRSLDYTQLFRPGSYQYRMTCGGEILTGYTEEYKIKTLDSTGRTIRLLENDYRPIPITKVDVEEITKKEINRGGSPSEIKVPKYHLPFFSFLPDEEGRIFVCTYERTGDREGEYWDIFDKEGRYIGRQAFRRRPQFWKGGKLYAIESDEDGNKYVKRYSVRWLV